MLKNNLKLTELLDKVRREQALSYSESQCVRNCYKEFRGIVNVILNDCADDEVRAIAVQSAVIAFDRNRMTHQQFITDVTYAMHTLRDRRIRSRRLRFEVAYHTALATYFHSFLKGQKILDSRLPVVLEFLHQMTALDAAIKTYSKHREALCKKQVHLEDQRAA